jgi:transcriptional regulator with XRE-family HTH domain
MSERSAFGSWLRQRRRRLDLTREELASHVGCAAVTIRRIEAGERRPSKQLAVRLADALGLEAEERAPFLLAARRELAGAQLSAPQPRLDSIAAGATNTDRTPGGPAPLPSLSGPLRGRGYSNLPAQLTPLIGRAGEAQQVCVLLLRDDVRLITLSGPGGIGKTRLAF